MQVMTGFVRDGACLCGVIMCKTPKWTVMLCGMAIENVNISSETIQRLNVDIMRSMYFIVE